MRPSAWAAWQLAPPRRFLQPSGITWRSRGRSTLLPGGRSASSAAQPAALRITRRCPRSDVPSLPIRWRLFRHPSFQTATSATRYTIIRRSQLILASTVEECPSSTTPLSRSALVFTSSRTGSSLSTPTRRSKATASFLPDWKQRDAAFHQQYENRFHRAFDRCTGWNSFLRGPQRAGRAPRLFR